MRCRSWRPVAVPGHSLGHEPGTCRVCWRPCFASTEGDQIRCSTCLDMLAQHPDATIRRHLAREADLPEDIAELLATDFDAIVQNEAQRRLNEIHGVDVEPTLETERVA